LPETPVSLLERLRLHLDPLSWQRLVDIYTPLIRLWLRRHALQPSDAEDLAQEVMSVVVREMPNFHHEQRPGAFRRWLRRVTVNRVRGYLRSLQSQPNPIGANGFEAILSQLEDPHSDLSRHWDEEHDRHVVRRLLELVEPEFEATTWRAFLGLVLEERDTDAVARDLGISPNAVRIAKSRILSRFRQEVAGLID
jgi:RNA polymerase sigma-70 factor, ECF subfamily